LTVQQLRRQMTQRPAKAASKTSTERRSGRDRRQLDKGPPGRVDRRRVAEPRKPEVSELEVSESEWGALAEEAFRLPARKPDPTPEGG